MRRTLIAAVLLASPAWAADHTEAPGAAADPAADIADFYAWAADDTFTAIVTFAPLTAAGGDATYDEDVLYGVHIDRDGDHKADDTIWMRFGKDGDGNWGVQAAGIPGRTDAVQGAVETKLEDAGVTLWAGLRDDPFFFDLAGYQTTLQTGTLSFDGSRDSLAGVNVTSLVISVPLSDVVGNGSTISTWTTTARK